MLHSLWANQPWLGGACCVLLGRGVQCLKKDPPLTENSTDVFKICSPHSSSCPNLLFEVGQCHWFVVYGSPQTVRIIS